MRILFFILFLSFGLAVLLLLQNIIFTNQIPAFTFLIILLIFLALIIAELLLLVLKISLPLKEIEKFTAEMEDIIFDYGENQFIKDYENRNSSEKLKIISTYYKETIDKEHKLQLLRKQAEIDALQSQINPHFLYNTLDSIRGQAMAQDAVEIAEMTEALSNYFRYTINQKSNFVSLKDEIANIESYITIQKHRFQDKLALVYRFDTEDKKMFELKILKMILQPIVENAIYHGLELKIGRGTITIDITFTEKRLIITISDDGIGIEPKQLKYLESQLRKESRQHFTEHGKNNNSIGIALLNVNDRIKMFYGDEYGIFVSSTLSVGTDVEIIIPIIDNANKI